MNTAQMRKLSREVIKSRAIYGLIIMFYGTVEDIPLGWRLCDGTNGTPNLTDKMLLGWGTLAVGGSGGGDGAHTHGTSQAGGHTHTCNQGGIHTIADGIGESYSTRRINVSGTYTGAPSGGDVTLRKADGDSTSAALHSHSLGSGAHSHTTLSTSDFPAYRRLMFLMSV